MDSSRTSKLRCDSMQSNDRQKNKIFEGVYASYCFLLEHIVYMIANIDSLICLSNRHERTNEGENYMTDL